MVWLFLLIALLIITASVAMRDAHKSSQVVVNLRSALNVMRNETETLKQHADDWRLKHQRAALTAYDRLDQLNQANITIVNLEKKLDELNRELNLLRRSFAVSEQDRELTMCTILEVRAVIDAFLCSNSASARVPQVADNV